MKRGYVIIGLCCWLLPLWGQGVADDIQQLVEDYMVDNDRAEIDVELLYEDLYALHENPLNINIASALDLQRLPFLSPFHIQSLLDYRQRFGDFVSLYELQAIYGFDRMLIEKIQPFITLDSVEAHHKTKAYWRHQLLMRSTTVVETQAGYLRPDSLSHYQGKPYSALVKYQGSLKKTWSWHLTGDQDRGEAWGAHAPIMDFISAGIQFQGEKWLQNVIVGDYRLCFGEGLLLNTNFGYGKSAQVLNINQSRPALRRSTSTAEYGFFRGLATHLRWGSMDVFLGASLRKADASVDTIDGAPYIQSFLQTGFHRTASEVAKYRSQDIKDAFAHIDYSLLNLKLGLTFTAQSLQTTWQAASRPDNAYLPRYKDRYQGSFNYKWNRRGLLFFGELATAHTGGIAGVQGLQVQASSRVDLSVLYRYYAPDYYAPYAQAFGEGSAVRNEEGLYMGLNLLVAKGWSLSTYFDFYRFPWLRYGQSRPTSGYDFFIQPQYDASRQTSMYWRIKYEEKEEKSATQAIQEGLTNTQKLNLRYHLKSQVNTHLTLQTRIAAALPLHTDDEYGIMLYQDLKGLFFNDRLAITLRYALYHTTSYHSRIYTYESDVLYLSYTPALYGSGSRSYINTSLKLSKNLTVYLKTAYSQSFDGHLFGTGLDATHQNHKTDIHFQIRYKF